MQSRGKHTLHSIIVKLSSFILLSIEGKEEAKERCEMYRLHTEIKQCHISQELSDMLIYTPNDDASEI